LFILCLLLLTAFLPAGAAVKWHPGHYALVNPNDGGEAAFNVVVNNDCLVGAQIMFRWRQFEREQGVYDFSELRRWLKYLGSRGKRTMLLLVLQSYGNGGPCVPDYLLQNPAYRGGMVVYHDASGKAVRATPKFWIPAVTDRLIALNAAIAREFDGEPFFEAFQRAEVAVRRPVPDDTGFEPAALNRETLREFTALCGAFRQTIACIGANWATREDTYFRTAAASGVGGIWGPDVVMRHPDNPKALDGTMAYPHYPAYRGKIPLMISDQGGFESNAMKGMTMAQVWDFAIADPAGLQVSHMIWTARHKSFHETVLPWLQAKHGFIANTARPENLRLRDGEAGTPPVSSE